MVTTELVARVRHDGALPTVDLHGEITAGADKALAAAYDAAAADNPAAIALDFRDVPYINSTGIAVIVGVLARARRDRREVRAHGLSDHYREIFEITRLADFLRIVPDEAETEAAAH